MCPFLNPFMCRSAKLDLHYFQLLRPQNLGAVLPNRTPRSSSLVFRFSFFRFRSSFFVSDVVFVSVSDFVFVSVSDVVFVSVSDFVFVSVSVHSFVSCLPAVIWGWLPSLYLMAALDIPMLFTESSQQGEPVFSLLP